MPCEYFMSIILDPATHVYSKGLVTYTSVSAVIKSVLPTDFSGVPPEVLENARLRGVFVDETFCAWLNGKCPVIPKGTDQDWVNRLQMLIEWWNKNMDGEWETQVTLSDEANLIAGTVDLRNRAEKRKLDLKVVSELQPAYSLQLGAYGWMEETEAIGIIHVTKDRVRLVKYDLDDCCNTWVTALFWYQAKKRLVNRLSRP